LDAKLSSAEWGYLPAVLLANKSDLPAHSRIQEKDLDRLAQEENFAAWFLTSAKDDLNITEATDFLADRMINRLGASAFHQKIPDPRLLVQQRLARGDFEGLFSLRPFLQRGMASSRTPAP
jgi:hypothetical protein